MNNNLAAYERITNAIIARLDAGVVPWRKGWKTRGGTHHADSPRNFISKKVYRGINFWMLAGLFQTPFWLTFKQAQQIGGKVRKGEKGTTVVFWNILKRKDKETGEEKKVFFLRYYVVFNVEQCEGIDPAKVDKLRASFQPTKEEEATPFCPHDAAEGVISGYTDCPPIRYGGDTAAYSPAIDMIKMPKREDFDTEGRFYSVLFHEMAHSTGSAKRLAREGIVKFDRFGSEQYAREELVAEFASTFLLSQCDMEQPELDNAAAYIADWKRKLANDPKLLVSAASQAQRASEFILGVKDEPETVEAEGETVEA